MEQPAKMRTLRIGPAVAAVLLLALAAVYAVPRAIDAFYGLDDPSRVASRALDDTFDAAVAGREIEAALAANDADLAQSFVDLAATRNVAIDPVLQERVTSATAEAATARHKAKSFARGFITGEPDDMRNTILGRRFEGRRFEFVFLATLIAGFWSLMSGLVLVTTLQACGFLLA